MSIAQFKLLRKIGEGAFGDAYLATDQSEEGGEGQQVVVKLFKNNSKIPSENVRKMWDQELDPARKQFNHVNVVQTLGAG